MNVMANPGVDKLTFELASLAASAINGCGACMDAHERTLRPRDIDAQGVQSALKIAAVVHAVALTLEQSNPKCAWRIPYTPCNVAMVAGHFSAAPVEARAQFPCVSPIASGSADSGLRNRRLRTTSA